MDAYEDMLNQTSTEWAPWYIIPADKKWVTHASVSEIIVSQIKKLNLKYPIDLRSNSQLWRRQRLNWKKNKRLQPKAYGLGVGRNDAFYIQLFLEGFIERLLILDNAPLFKAAV